jgi:hypothetical protein
VGAAEANDPLGWIIARYEDRQYVEGNDPCLNQVPMPRRLTFEYDRQAAAHYAIEHSYQNDLGIPASERVTRRLMLSGLRFANFDYTDLGSQGESTGSAMFVSEVIWMGGMPMTVGDPNSCSIVQYLEAGWRFCWNVNADGGDSSTPWEFHKTLGEYYTTATLPPSYLSSNTLLDPSGFQIMFNGTDANDRLTFVDLNNYIGAVINGGVGHPIDPPVFSTYVKTHLGQLKAGDYMWINSYNPGNPNSTYHGLTVVGWNAPLDCATAINNTYLSTSFYVAYTDAGSTSVVPWVADFTNPAKTQRMVPRPFYCTQYDEDENPSTGFVPHDWFFYMLPESVNLPVSQLFVDPNWQWNATHGR